MGIHNCRPSGYIMYNRIKDHHHCGSFNTGDTYNIKFNCNGGHTNFWGGLGAGLGMGLGNMFGGFFGNILGNFGLGMGGFGMGGFGFGMPGWGGGLSGLWGGSASKNYDADVASKYSGSKSSSTCNCNCSKSNTSNLDHAALNTYSKGVDNLIKGINGTPTEEQIKQAKDYLDKLKNYAHKDKINENDDNTSIQNIIDRLKMYFPSLDDEEPVATFELPEITITPDGGGDATPESAPAKGSVTIGGKPIKIDDITKPSDLNGLTFEEAGKINKDDAIKILDNIGMKNSDGSYKMSIKPAILQLLATAEVNVACAKNPGSDDKWVKGKISNVVLKDNKVSYDVDCKGVADAKFEYKYSFEQQEANGNKFRLTEIDKNSSDKIGYIASDWASRDYNWDDTKSCLIITGKPQISENKNGRKKLEDKASTTDFS